MRFIIGVAVVSFCLIQTACSESPEARRQREQRTLAEATSLVAAGKFADANTKLAGVSETREVTALRRKATEGVQKQEEDRRAREAAAEADAIKARLAELSVSNVTSMDGVRTTLATFGAAENYLRSHSAESLANPAKAVRAEFRMALSRKQAALFPAMRGAYAKHLAQTLWENDVEVIASGSGNKRIRFIAGMFAANRNIATAQQAAGSMLRDLRFTRSQYEWYRGSEYTYYDLEPEADAHVPD